MTTQLPGTGAVLGGDFRIERQLGAGGMGAVYVAEQLSTGRRRALKLMHPSLVSDAKLRERFEQEARVGARISSDHVVQVIAAGVDEATGSPFIAMELLDGEDLSTTMARRGALPPEDVRQILQPVCHALGAAHAVGIVHRDLKPENIFLLHTQDVQRSFDVKLLDFGIAKLTADARTMATSAVGTPLWMAPEQTDPRSKIAPTADVWPLGLLVFSMLTGRSYWRVASEAGVSVPALMREILFETIDAASVRAVELGIEVPLPVGFDAWFSKCLDREASRRFPTAKEAWEALVPVLGAEVQAPAQLAALVRGAAGVDRARLEVDATVPVTAMAPTLPVSGLSGMEATVDASKLGSLGAAGNTTGVSVGQTVPTVVAPQRSALRTVGAIAAAALIGVVSWQVATSRAERHIAKKENADARREAAEAAEQSTTTAPAPRVDVAPGAAASDASVAPNVGPNAPLANSVVAAAPTSTWAPKPVKPKLPPFDAEAAQRRLDNLKFTVENSCSGRRGPRAFSVTVVFSPAGKTVKVKANVPMASDASSCAESIYFGVPVAPYDPAFGNSTVSVGVSLK